MSNAGWSDSKLQCWKALTDMSERNFISDLGLGSTLGNRLALDQSLPTLRIDFPGSRGSYRTHHS